MLFLCCVTEHDTGRYLADYIVEADGHFSARQKTGRHHKSINENMKAVYKHATIYVDSVELDENEYKGVKPDIK